MSQTAFVSTAIPYVNAKPHVGFAVEMVQADAIARYIRLTGYDTFFLTGTDENSLKNVRAAAELEAGRLYSVMRRLGELVESCAKPHADGALLKARAG